MSVLIQDKTTGKFIFSGESWTEHTCQALDLESSDRAVKLCRRLHLKNIQIIIRSGQDEKVFDLAEESPPSLRKLVKNTKA